MSARSLFPREHGASMELLFPLLTVWSLGRPTVASIALGASSILVLVMHESVLVLTGRRGERRRAEQRGAAIGAVAALGTCAAALGGLGTGMAGGVARASVALPLLLGGLVLVFALRGRERTTPVELLVAAALTSIALPVGLTSGLDARRACGVALAWWAGFAIATLAARGVLLREKDDGARLRRAGKVAAAALCAAAAVALSGAVPLGLAIAPVPFAIAALVLAVRPPPPRRMTAVGVSLAAASVLAWLAMIAL